MQHKDLIGIVLICIALTITSGCFGYSYNPPQTTVPTVQAISTPERPSALVKMSWSNGVVTADVTNSGSTTLSFILMVDFYDGDVKVDTRYVDIPSLTPGQTGRAKGYAPSGANRYQLSAVATTIGGKVYKVTYDVAYQ